MLPHANRSDSHPSGLAADLRSDMINSAWNQLMRYGDCEPADLRSGYGFAAADVDAFGARAISLARQRLREAGDGPQGRIGSAGP